MEPDAATGPRAETEHDRLEQRVEWIETTLVDLARYMHNAASVLDLFMLRADWLAHRNDAPVVLFDQDAQLDTD